jgi:hypothetical protein
MVECPLPQWCVHGLKHIVQDKKGSIAFCGALDLHLNQYEERQEVELSLA